MTYTTLPPVKHEYGHGGNAPHFDLHQFAGRRAMAVSATSKGRDDWDSTGLSFGDFSGMHVYSRKKMPQRRVPVPAWATDRKQTTELILKACENRFYIDDHSGTTAERLARIAKKSGAYLPTMRQTLVDLESKYHIRQVEGATNLEAIEVEIQNIDTQIVLAKRGIPAVMNAVVYCYYRLGWNSSTIAEEFGIKPPMVRIWLYRLNHLSKGLRSDGLQRRGRRIKKPLTSSMKVAAKEAVSHEMEERLTADYYSGGEAAF